MGGFGGSSSSASGLMGTPGPLDSIEAGYGGCRFGGGCSSGLGGGRIPHQSLSEPHCGGPSPGGSFRPPGSFTSGSYATSGVPQDFGTRSDFGGSMSGSYQRATSDRMQDFGLNPTSDAYHRADASQRMSSQFCVGPPMPGGSMTGSGFEHGLGSIASRAATWGGSELDPVMPGMPFRMQMPMPHGQGQPFREASAGGSAMYEGLESHSQHMHQYQGATGRSRGKGRY